MCGKGWAKVKVAQRGAGGGGEPWNLYSHRTFPHSCYPSASAIQVPGFAKWRPLFRVRGFGVAALQPSWRFAMLGPGPGRRGRGQARQEAEKERVKAGLLMPYSERGAPGLL